MTLLSESELRERLVIYEAACVKSYLSMAEEGMPVGEALAASKSNRDELIALIIDQQHAWGEEIIGEDMKEYHPNAPFERDGVKMSPRGENQRIRNENNLRAEQRKRNNEKGK